MECCQSSARAQARSSHLHLYWRCWCYTLKHFEQSKRECPVCCSKKTKSPQSYFSIQLPDPEAIQFVFLYKRRWIEAKSYPYFTMLGQSLGSILLGWEALSAVNPHLFIGWLIFLFCFFFLKKKPR